MSTKRTLKEIKAQVKFFEKIFAHCILDMQGTNGPEDILYNIDFQFLFPYLFTTNVKNAKPFEPQYHKMFTSLIKAPDHNVKYSLVFSGPSFLEFIDQIEHRREYLQYSLYQLNKYCDKYASGKKIENNLDILATRPAILKALEVVTAEETRVELRSAVNKLKDLISSGRFSAVGDVLGNKLSFGESDKQHYLNILDNMQTVRLPIDRQRNTRSDEDSIFHYKIDCLNATLSKAVNEQFENKRLYMTTKEAFNLEACRVNDEYFGRNPTVPLFILNSYILKEKKCFKSVQDFLEEALLHADKVVERMSDFENLEDMYFFDVRKISEFYEHYIHTLNQETMKMEKRMENTSKDQLVKMLADPNRLQDAFEEAQDHLVDVANDINEFFQEFDEGMGEVFEISNDPVVQKIKKNLKLKKGLFDDK